MCGLVYWPGIMLDVDTTNVYYLCTIKCLVPIPGSDTICSLQERYKKFSRLLFETDQTKLFNMLYFKNISVLIDKTLAGNYAVSDYEKSSIFREFEIMSEDILKMYIIGMTRRNWVLLLDFNKLADRIFEAGFVYHWDEEAIYLTSSQKIQNILKIRDAHNDVKRVRTLRMLQARGIFVVWGAGMLISIFVFLCEKYVFERQKKN
ncbi:hypothetical protein Trydic_g5603 [Trypoxylus dichotomus]